jgi:hypothetical protein
MPAWCARPVVAVNGRGGASVNRTLVRAPRNVSVRQQGLLPM